MNTHKIFIKITACLFFIILMLQGTIIYSITSKSVDEEISDFIILCPVGFSNELTSLKIHKENHGISTEIITLEEIYNGSYFPVVGRDQPEQIKYFIKNAVEHWQTKYVMLVGNKNIMPVRYTNIYIITGNYSYYISDLYYADLYFPNGSFCSWDSNNDDFFAEKNNSGYIDIVDLYPDVCVGRILCNTSDGVANFVDKVISYETSTYGQSWFNNLIVCGGDFYLGFLKEALLPFMLGRIGRVVWEGEYMGNQVAKILSGFTAKKIYTTGFCRPNVQMLTKENMKKTIDLGAGFILFNGHGNPETAMVTQFPFTWPIKYPKPNGYNLSDIQQLENGDKLPVGVFMGCNCADFNASISPVAWEMIKHVDGGAIACFACTSGGQAIPTSLITETLHGHLAMGVFKTYASGVDIVGEIWYEILTDYLNDDEAWRLGDAFSMLNWHNMLSNHFILESWVLLGDPTLKIGGYQ